MKLNFKKNLGKTERIIRASIGILLILLAYSKVLMGFLSILSIIIGLMLIIDALISYCILYDLLGVSSK